MDLPRVEYNGILGELESPLNIIHFAIRHRALLCVVDKKNKYKKKWRRLSAEKYLMFSRYFDDFLYSPVSIMYRYQKFEHFQGAPPPVHHKNIERGGWLHIV